MNKYEVGLLCFIVLAGAISVYLGSDTPTKKEYQMDVSLTGYVIFDREGNTVGVIPYGECLKLDTIINEDNL